MNKPPRPVPLRIVDAVGSLKVTVVLLSMSIFLVFAGTLAQVDRGIWTVMERYFRCWIAWIELKVFFSQGQGMPGSFPFPGGILIGVALAVNMAVSHFSRIRVKARGGRLVVGLGVLGIGVAMTWIMIAHDSSERTLDPFWRMTFLLLKCLGVAIVLIAGCGLVFGRKAGIVQLHAGILLMMIGEFVTYLGAKEAMMRVHEGQRINFVEDTRTSELAIVDESDAAADDVVVVPARLLEKGGRIPLASLPFDLEVSPGRYMKNADLRAARPGDANPASVGAGLQWLAVPRREGSGVDTSAGADEPAVYATFVGKASGSPIGTVLGAVRLSHEQVRQTISAGGKEYAVALRFERVYKPYSIYLYDFQFKRYVGTDKPKDFSSYVRLEDAESGVSRDVRIWMNNPLRYRGDTLYQADWDKESEAGTVLQVVENQGRMIPYLGCAIVAVGLLAQFLLHLFIFLWGQVRAK